MNKWFLILATGSLIFVGGCINKSSVKTDQNSLLQNETSGGAMYKSGSVDSTSELGTDETILVTGDKQPPQDGFSNGEASTVSPEEEKLIEDILNSIFEN